MTYVSDDVYLSMFARDILLLVRITFTLARWPHQHRSALSPRGKLAFIAFFGLKSWSEQGTLMVEFRRREEEDQLVHQNKTMPGFIEGDGEKWRERMTGNGGG